MNEHTQQISSQPSEASTITVPIRPNCEQRLRDWLDRPHVWHSWARLIGCKLEPEGTTLTFTIIWRGLAEEWKADWRAFQRTLDHLVDWSASEERVWSVLLAQED